MLITAVTDLKEFQRFALRQRKKYVHHRTCPEHVSFSDEGPLFKTLEFFEINHGSYLQNITVQNVVILYATDARLLIERGNSLA